MPWCFFSKEIKAVGGNKLSERKKAGGEGGSGQSRSLLLAEGNRDIPVKYRSSRRLQKGTGHCPDPLSNLNSCICVLKELHKIIGKLNKQKKEYVKNLGNIFLRGHPRLRL